FTSGSTSRPKGVTVTHGNLAANIHCIMVDGLRANGETDVGVSWLPLYHDMGLIGFVLAPMMYQVPIVFLPPLLFLKRPVSWFQAVTKHKGTIAFAPNFAYALCRKRIREKDLEGIDLSSWRVAGCGAEPIRAETLQGFASEYAKVGFRKEALLPSYGMAESALAISFTPVEQGLKTIAVDSEALWGTGNVKEISPTEGSAEPLHVVSCGPAFGKHTIAIFDPEDKTSATPLEDGRVGELRIKGPSVTPGYWQDEEKTNEAFAGSYLRTGDLGFIVRGDTYICGRSKEVVIVNGRNYYPQDMEWEASKVAGVRKGNVIAFGARDPSGADADRERVIIALETQEKMTEEKLGPLSQAVRKSVQEGMGLTLDDVVILPPGTLPKTSSGKLQRAKTRQLYEAGELVAVEGGKSSVSKLDIAKEAAKSQLSYLKLAIFGGRNK
ncbi:MAG: fatty acyl-AMP ligase, partial [Polyangiaceae bacterium]|nr:fatty acyl-AMP ligase [Polyangiaceae bacterium]